MENFFKKRPLAVLILCFLALRLTTLLTWTEYVAWYHEASRGIIAKELIEGLKAPLWGYQADHYNSGSLWVGVLAVPFFLLLGSNLFALKLVALLFSLGVLVLSFFFFEKFFDRKIALWVSALLILPPPVFTVLSLMVIGSHTESILFTVVLFFCLYEFLYGEARNKTLCLILLGLVGGAGVWFCLTTLITLFTCLVSWFLLDRRSFLSPKILIFLGCFGIGILPLIFYNLTHEEGIFQFLRYALLWNGEGGESTLVPKLKFTFIRMVTLVFESLPFSFRFRSFFHISRHLLSGFYGLLVIFLLVPFLWREAQRLLPLLKESLRHGKVDRHKLEATKLIPFFLFLLFFILAYSVNNYPVSYLSSGSFEDFRYFAPFYYLAFSLLALALRTKKRPLPFLGLLLGLGLIGQGSLLFKEPFGRDLRYQGYSYSVLGETWGVYLYPFPKKLEEVLSQSNRFPEPERRYLFWGLANAMDYHLEPKMLWDSEMILKEIHRLPAAYRPYFLESWGRNLCWQAGQSFDHQIATLGFNKRIANLAGSIPEKERPYFYYGITTSVLLDPIPFFTGDCLRSLRAEDIPYPRMYYFSLGRSLYHSSFREKVWNEAALEVLDSLGADEKLWAYRGMGVEAARFWIYNLALKGPDPLWSKVPPQGRDPFFWGVGWGIREEVVEDRVRALGWFQKLPAETQALAWEGFLASERWYEITPKGMSASPWTSEKERLLF